MFDAQFSKFAYIFQTDTQEIIFLFLFLSTVTSYYISDAPCLQPSLGTLPAGVETLQDTLLFIGCENVTEREPWIYLYNLTSNMWTTQPYPQVSYSPTTVTSKEAIFFIGGSLVNIFLDSVIIYNVTTNIWSSLTLSKARGDIKAVATEQILFCAGGVIDIYGTETTLVEIYNFTSDSWDYFHLTSPNIIDIYVVDDTVYILEQIDHIYLVETYEISSNTWDSFQLETNGTYYTSVIVNNTSILFCSMATPLAIVEVYDIDSKNLTQFTLFVSNNMQLLARTAGQYAILSYRSSPHDTTFLYHSHSFTPISPYNILSSGGDFILLQLNTSSPYLFISHNKTFTPAFIDSQKITYVSNDFVLIFPLPGASIIELYSPYINKIYASYIFTGTYFAPYSLHSGFIIVTNQNSYAFKTCVSNETCDDGIFCNGMEYCGNDSYCASGPPPCPDSTLCTQCNEQSESCFSPIGTPCPGHFCDGISTCDGFGQCVGSGNPCLNQALCNQRCDRNSSVCVADKYGTECGNCLICDGFGDCTNTPERCGKSDIKPWEIGIVVGVIVLLAIIAFIVFFIKRKKNYGNYEPIPDREIDTVTFHIIDDIVILEKIASGEFGDVFRGIMDKNVEVALKGLKSNYFHSKEFQREVKMLSALNHPNIVRLYGVYEATKMDRYMVFEYMSKGSLNKLLNEQKDAIKFKTLLKMAAQIAGGMRYLESNFIVHRDLALRNVFATIDQNAEYVVKIGDFGMSRTVDKGYYQTLDKTIPVRWSAPEFIHFGTTSSKSDVFSFGVCLWELVTYGEIPYAGWKNTTVIEKVTAGTRLPQPAGCPDDVYRIMQMCWQFEPEKRPSFDELHTKLSSMANSCVTEEEKKAETDYSVYN